MSDHHPPSLLEQNHLLWSVFILNLVLVWSYFLLWRMQQMFSFCFVLYLLLYLLPPDWLLWAPPPRQTPSPATLVASPLPENNENKILTGSGLSYALTWFSGSLYKINVAFKAPAFDRNFSLPHPLLPRRFFFHFKGIQIGSSRHNYYLWTS